MATPFAFHLVVHESSSCTTALPALSMTSLNFSLSGGYVVVPQCGFNVHFPDDKLCCASFHVLTGYLHTFFCDVSVHMFLPI